MVPSKRRLVFATNNQNKLKEIQNLLSEKLTLLSLKDIGFSGDIPETGNTLEENASQKAWFIYNRYKMDCFADDTGLEIEALNGRPGVYSARYAGPNCNADDNIRKVLEELAGIDNRNARFRTIVSLILEGKELQFEGRVEGKIPEQKKGKDGFGYDPVFQPEGYALTFAEMTLNEKNKISHRAKAVKKLVHYLNNL